MTQPIVLTRRLTDATEGVLRFGSVDACTCVKVAVLTDKLNDLVDGNRCRHFSICEAEMLAYALDDVRAMKSNQATRLRGSADRHTDCIAGCEAGTRLATLADVAESLADEAGTKSVALSKWCAEESRRYEADDAVADVDAMLRSGGAS